MPGAAVLFRAASVPQTLRDRMRFITITAALARSDSRRSRPTKQPHGLTVHLKLIRQRGFSACQTGDLRNPHMAESVARPSLGSQDGGCDDIQEGDRRLRRSAHEDRPTRGNLGYAWGIRST